MTRYITYGVYVLVTISAFIYTWSSRDLPSEPDDAVSYISKSAQITHDCFYQDCPALNDLRPQLDWEKEEDKAVNANILSSSFSKSPPSVSWNKYVWYFRTFPVYHLAYSVLLASAYEVFGDWTPAYNTVWLLGLLVLPWGIWRMTESYWGKEALALTFLVLVAVRLSGHGLDIITPSVWSLALAFHLWSVKSIQSARVVFTQVILAVLVMLMHTIGLVYVFAYALYLIHAWYTDSSRLREPRPWTEITCGLLLLGIMGLWVLIRYSVTSPELTAPLNSWPQGLSLLGGYKQILAGVFGRKIFLSYAWIIAFGVAFYARPRFVTDRSVILGFWLILIWLASFLYPLPYAWGLVPLRISVPVFVFALGGCAREVEIRLRSILTHRPARYAIAVFSIVVFGIGSVFRFRTAQSRIEPYNFALEANLVLPILRDADPDSPTIVYYDNPVVMSYYLSVGLYDHGALLGSVHPSLSLTRQVNTQPPRYLLLTNPLRGDRKVSLRNIDRLLVRHRRSRLTVSLRASEDSTQVTVSVGGKSQIVELNGREDASASIDCELVQENEECAVYFVSTSESPVWITDVTSDRYGWLDVIFEKGELNTYNLSLESLSDYDELDIRDAVALLEYRRR